MEKGIVMIDETVADAYPAFMGSSELDPRRFHVVKPDHNKVVDRNHERKPLNEA